MTMQKKDKKMKKYISVIVLLSLFVIGCTEQTSVTSPVNKVQTQEPNWISLPNGESGMSVMSMPIFEVSKNINGKNGGRLNINERYDGGPFGEVKVKAQIEFPKGSFTDTKYITMILDTQFGLATFLPHSNFDKDAIYNVEFWGLDLSSIDPSKVNFVYQAEDGSYEYIERSRIQVDVKNGWLKLTDARLPHFSRYGFVN
jgi:hypothetical protein